ncbi:MAG: efflux transporter outer membrane subunit [Syntrophobacteraceae bacterium]
MITKTLSLLVIAAMLISGCTMIPKYTQPEAPVPGGWPTGPAYSGSASVPGAPLAADLQWREFFTDERLQKVIESALQNNRDLRLAALNVEMARALYRIQRVELLPTVDATGSSSRQLVPGELSRDGRATTSNVYNADLGISSWEIDFFGRIRSLEKRALEEYFATEQARRSVQILLISEVATAYLTLASDRENLKLAQATLETQQESFNLIRRRFEVGLLPELDVRQVQTLVDAARVKVAQFTDLVARDENALNLLVGSPLPADQLPAELSVVASFPDFSPGMTSDVLLRRPDISRAENMLKAADANIGAARAALFPRISLTSNVGTASADLSGLFESGSLAWIYAPKIVLPIFDARAWSALKATKVDREIAVTQYEKAIQGAFREVADELARRGTLGDQLEAQQSLVNAAGDAYRLSNARYTKGIDIYLNVLVAQRSLYSAQEGLIAIRLAKLSNQVRLYAVLGGGGDAVTAQKGE